MKLIISNSLTGLGNRLENIVSLYRLALIHKCDFKFFWNINEWAIRTFEELFSNFHNHIITDLSIIRRKSEYKSCLIFEPNGNFEQQKEKVQDFDILVFNTDSVVLNNSEDVLYNLYNVANILKPSFKVTSYSNIVLSNHDVSNIPAIHVRTGVINRTEEKDIALRNPPMIYEYDEYIEKNVEGQFFLSADTNLVKDRFKTKYGDKAIILPTTDNYKEHFFCIHSLSDMYIMSQCKEIVGSQSSFNRFAALWGIKKRILLRHNTEPYEFLPENFLTPTEESVK